ncbi:MAG: prolyl oligopeptidase family serine peptidase [Opitutales bacterium]|nr:prolyl oligopeptidase family serine peptidase [Opitutales bacterium]
MLSHTPKLLVSSLLLASSFSLGLLAEEHSADYFIQPLQCKQVTFSPDSSKIAYLRPFSNEAEGYWGVFSEELDGEGKSGWLPAGKGDDVDTYSWIDGEHIVFQNWSSSHGTQQASVGTFGKTNTPAKEIHVGSFTIFNGAQNQPYFYARSDDAEGTSIVQYSPTEEIAKVYTVAKPGSVDNIICDNTGTVRLVNGKNTSEQQVWLYRASPNAAWEQLPLQGYTGILGFTADNQKLIVATAMNTETQGLYLYDPSSKSFETPLLTDKVADLNTAQLICDKSTGDVLGVNYQSLFPKTQWFVQDMADVQKVIDQNIPQSINRVIEADLSKQRFLIESISDHRPASYFILDLTQGKLEERLNAAPWVNPDEMASMSVVQFANRDGMKLFGYFTKATKKASDGPNPTILYVKDQLWQRSYFWGWDPMVQYLANHGYNVFMVCHRSTPGMGWRISGGQGDMEMVAVDLEDATRWAIEKGLAAEGQIGIMGESLNAFAAAYNAAKHPELYSCAIVSNGVYDLAKYADAGKGFSGNVTNAYRQKKGASFKAYLESISPVNLELSVPFHVSHGCKQAQGDEFQAADLIRRVKKSKSPVQTYESVYWKMGSWSGEQGIEYYDSIMKFLDSYLPVK